MALWLIFMSCLIFLFSTWARRYETGTAGLIGVGTPRPAGYPATTADVQLTSVLAMDRVVLLEFQAAIATLYATGRPPAQTAHPRQNLILSIESDAASSVALMRGWEESGVAVVMWCDASCGRVELSRLRTGQRVVLSVIPAAVNTGSAFQ